MASIFVFEHFAKHNIVKFICQGWPLSNALHSQRVKSNNTDDMSDIVNAIFEEMVSI